MTADRQVTIVGPVWYDFEHGYFLTDDPGCKDNTDNTDVMDIELPPGSSFGDFPDLLKTSSQKFLRANRGRRLFCTCAGEISYSDGYAKFVLTSAKVWSAER